MANGQFSIDNMPQEFSISVHEISGTGGFESPRILVPLSIRFNPYRKGEQYPYEEFDLLSIKADLYLTDKNFCASNTIQFHKHKVCEPCTYPITLIFALNEATLFHIEKHRKGGLPAAIQFQIQIAKYGSMPSQKGATEIPPRPCVCGFEMPAAHSNFVIEQSQWVKKILPSLGHKAAALIELPAASNYLPAEYAKSMGELEKSREYFVLGDYDKTVGHCRTAMEPFKDNMPALKAAFESQSKYDWLKKMQLATWDWMDKMLKVNSGLTSKSHHFPSIGHFSRTDAEVMLNITILLLSYIAQLTQSQENNLDL